MTANRAARIAAKILPNKLLKLLNLTLQTGTFLS